MLNFKNIDGPTSSCKDIVLCVYIVLTLVNSYGKELEVGKLIFRFQIDSTQQSQLEHRLPAESTVSAIETEESGRKAAVVNAYTYTCIRIFHDRIDPGQIIETQTQQALTH